jgi:proprotein convertase subtilisin/kexin type 1
MVHSSSSAALSSNPGWQTNGAGMRFNSRFGFGLMDALKMVTMAEKWKNVREQKRMRFENEKM